MFKGYKIYRFHMIGFQCCFFIVVVHASVCLLHFLFVFHCCFAIHFISFVGFFLLAKSVSFHYSSIDLLCFVFLFITLCIDLCFNSIVCCITLCLICVSYSFYCIFQTFHSIHMCCFVSFHMVFLFLLACSLFVCVYFDCLHIHYCVSYSFY